MSFQTASQELDSRIQKQGAITFAEFMSLALYSPNGGYYTHLENFSAYQDYYTAPSSHPIFGALLTIQIFQMWQKLNKPDPFWIIELGASNGLLCHDIVKISAHLPEGFPDTLRYLCVDFRKTLGFESKLPDYNDVLGRISASQLPLVPLVGCILSNELLDSFPVHVVQQQNGELQEVYVTTSADGFMEQLGPPSTNALEERLDNLQIHLGEGQRAEINLSLAGWFSEVANCLERGYLLTVDYGQDATDLYSRKRPNGTLTCYFDHIQTNNPFLRVGLQDLTTHVDFTTVTKLGIDVGLHPVAYLTQSKALHNLGIRHMISLVRESQLSQTEKDANRMGMLDLVRPEGMGDFKMLIQQKDPSEGQLWCETPDNDLEDMLHGLPLQLMTKSHVSSMAAKYPHLIHAWRTWDPQ